MELVVAQSDDNVDLGEEVRPRLNSAESSIIIKEFIMLKSLDVVSSGQYRKFVLRKKDL